MVNLENDAATISLPHPMPPNHDSITDFCEHDASDPPLITSFLCRQFRER
jgi:hypothetical protein